MKDEMSLSTEDEVFFITGNSRSGTTMMMRILNNHSQVHSINEPHFFEKLWTPDDQLKEVNRAEAFELFAKLLTGQRDGFFENVSNHREKYRAEIDTILNQVGDPYSRMGVYAYFMQYEAKVSGKKIPCEKTPQNVFYINEILEYFPKAKVVNMIRDPRGVMLSQKRKWKRKYLGADFITRKEMVRLRVNYHPVTISRLWVSAIGAVFDFESNSRVMNLKFEDLLEKPNQCIEAMCSFLEIPFETKMLLVPHAGSSSEVDKSSELGIRKGRAKSWAEKGLSQSEIHICQAICGESMKKYGYPQVEVNPGRLQLALLYASFPFKLGLALLLNLRRMRNIMDTIKRRWKNS